MGPDNVVNELIAIQEKMDRLLQAAISVTTDIDRMHPELMDAAVGRTNWLCNYCGRIYRHPMQYRGKGLNFCSRDCAIKYIDENWNRYGEKS